MMKPAGSADGEVTVVVADEHRVTAVVRQRTNFRHLHVINHCSVLTPIVSFCTQSSCSQRQFEIVSLSCSQRAFNNELSRTYLNLLHAGI